MFVKTSLQQSPAEGNTSLDEDVNRVQDQYEASKVNVITCLPNGEERCLSFLKEGGVVVGEVVGMNQGWVEGALETVDKGNIGY